MTDVKKVDKSAETGVANVAPYDKANDTTGTATDPPKTFSQAQAEYEAKEAVLAAQQANVKQEEPPEPMPSAKTQKEMAAGAKAGGGIAPAKDAKK